MNKKAICQECGQRINFNKRHTKKDCDYYKGYKKQTKPSYTTDKDGGGK